MRRFIVLCLIVLSALSFPGNASALLITGEVWQSALASASNPQSGPPSSTPDATFAVTDINFDSKRAANPGSISYDTFLNAVPGSWVINTTGFDPFAAMFSGTANPADKGIFFRFTTQFVIPQTITVTHDDGFYFAIPNVFEFGPDTSTPITGSDPAVVTFPVVGPRPGTYFPLIISYGALNDSVDHVLIFNAPEPWTILLLGIGMIGIGIMSILRKKS